MKSSCDMAHYMCTRVFNIETWDNVTQIRVKDKNIKEVTEESLEGLSLIMKDYDNVSLEYCFESCEKLEQIVFPPTFGKISVTSMSHMFYTCKRLRSLDLSEFDTSGVTSMSGMFAGCSSLSSLDLSTFNTSSVTGTYAMFCGCSSLKSLDLSTFDTSSVESDGTWSGCTCMFEGCSRLEEVYVKDERIKSKLRRGVTVRTK